MSIQILPDEVEHVLAQQPQARCEHCGQPIDAAEPVSPPPLNDLAVIDVYAVPLPPES